MNISETYGTSEISISKNVSVYRSGESSNHPLNKKFKGLTCDKCKTTEVQLLDLKSQTICVYCIETLAKENKIIAIDDDFNNKALEKYSEVFKKEHEKEQTLELGIVLINHFMNKNGDLSNNNAWLIACCLESDIRNDRNRESTFLTIRGYISQYFEDNYSTSQRKQKLLEMESAISCCKKILNGQTDYNQWEIKANGNRSLPEYPTLFYLAQIQPANWHAMGTTIFGSDFDDIASELTSQLPGDSRRQQFEMWKKALTEGRLKNWGQVETAITESRKMLSQVPAKRHHVLVYDNLSETLDSCCKWKFQGSQLYQKWREISELLAHKENWKEHTLKNGMPEITELNPTRSWVFCLLMMPLTTISEIDALHKKPDNSLSYQMIKKQISNITTLNTSWIIFYIAAHVSGQLTRFQIASCPMINEYIDNYGHMSVKLIDFDNPKKLLFSLFESANDLMSRIIQSLKKEPTSSNASEALSLPQKNKAPVSLLNLSSGIPENLKDDSICAICEENPLAPIILVPCKHAYMCKECTDKLKDCPLCRATITGTLTFFSPLYS